MSADPKLYPELKEASPHKIPVAYVEIDEQGYFQNRDQVKHALEIGRGSLVEFLTCLEQTVKPPEDNRNKLMLVGHSFGASVVFNSIAPILMERFLLDTARLASKTAGGHSQSKPGLVSGYGDLVVLVNPAIEATRIMPFFSMLNTYTAEQPNLFAPGQPARLVILSSEGDWATRITFPTARVFATMLEVYMDRELVTP